MDVQNRQFSRENYCQLLVRRALIMVLPFTNIVIRFDRIWKYRFWGTEDLRLSKLLHFMSFSLGLFYIFKQNFFKQKIQEKEKFLNYF